MSEIIVIVTGGFDPIHSGHIAYFEDAKKLGDKLVVGLNSDEWLINKKGRPFMPLSERIDGVTQIGESYLTNPNDETTRAVYPNVRSTEGFLVAGVLSYLDPENTATYQKFAEDFAERGIAYGHYGRSDMEASRSLANQYLVLFFQNNPDTLSSTDTIELIE